MSAGRPRPCPVVPAEAEDARPHGAAPPRTPLSCGPLPGFLECGLQLVDASDPLTDEEAASAVLALL